jgi:hypothetical protein
MMLASASVERYMLSDGHKFIEETQNAAGFSADLLMAVKDTMKTLRRGKYHVEFKEPITGETLQIVPDDPHPF